MEVVRPLKVARSDALGNTGETRGMPSIVRPLKTEGN